MKTKLFYFFMVNFTILNAQTSTSVLDFNSVSALLKDEGVLFENGNIAGYEVPKGSGIKAIFSSSFWFGGIDENGFLRLAGARFEGGGQDFYSGPFSSTDMYNDPAFISAYSNAIWTVSKAEIDDHILNYLTPGYIVPTAILNWPGNGITSLGVAQNLAPFNDVNGDNIYTPANGDFPKIRGDKASYIVMNDMQYAHTSSSGDQMGIEIHIMAYQYAATNFIDTTTFLNVRVFNRGIHTYTNFRTAYYTDGDVGYYSDDLVGCDSIKNLIYTYNGDNLDEAINGYGYINNPPCIGVVSLNHAMKTSGCYNAQSSFPFSDPTIAVQYWNFMNGKWSNGTPWYYGGMGYSGSAGVTTTQTNFLFSGNPYSGVGWSEVSNGNPSGDRRNFMVLDSVNLNPNQEECFDFAIIFDRHGNNLENVQGILDLADSVKIFFDNQIDYNCNQVTLGVSENQISEELFSVYPNPTDGVFKITLGKNIERFNIEITDLNGRRILSKDQLSGIENTFILHEKAGFYLITVSTENGVSTKQILIID